MEMSAARLPHADAERALAAAGELAACRDRAELEAWMGGLPGLIGADTVMVSRCHEWGGEIHLESGDPDLYGPALMAAFHRNGDEHPVLVADLGRPTAEASRLSDYVASRDWRRAALFNEFYRRLGMTHELTAQLNWGPGGSSSCIGLHRAGSDFAERDRLLLELLAPHLRAARTRIAATASAARRLELLVRDGRGGTEGTLVLDADGRLLSASDRGRELLAGWFGAADAVPAELARWRQQVRGGVGPTSYERRAGGRLLRAGLLAAEGEELILLSESDPAPLSPARLAERLPITARESEVLALLAAGETNDGIAHSLGISPRTAVRHVENLYRKIEVGSRAAATRAALEALA
jgi:DNA-binding CsgD family transcriptional regulator